MRIPGRKARGAHCRRPDDVLEVVQTAASDPDLKVVHTTDVGLQIVHDDAPPQVVTSPPVPEPTATAGRASRRERLLRFLDPRTARRRFRRFRRSRPFWAVIWVLLGGAIITYWPSTAYRFVFASASVTEGMSVGVLIVVLGFFLLFTYSDSLRKLYSVLIVLAAVASLITSDIGGFLFGMLFSMIGGAMAFAWMPVTPPSRRQRRREKRSQTDVAAAA